MTAREKRLVALYDLRIAVLEWRNALQDASAPQRRMTFWALATVAIFGSTSQMIRAVWAAAGVLFFKVALELALWALNRILMAVITRMGGGPQV